MVLLAVVTLFAVAVAGGASLVESIDKQPVQLADQTTARVEPLPHSTSKSFYVSDQRAVRVIGAPFVPNTSPRER